MNPGAAGNLKLFASGTFITLVPLAKCHRNTNARGPSQGGLSCSRVKRVDVSARISSEQIRRLMQEIEGESLMRKEDMYSVANGIRDIIEETFASAKLQT